MLTRKLVWTMLLLPLLIAGGRPAEAKENLQERLSEIRWRTQGYVAGGFMQPNEVDVIEDLVANMDWEETVIPKGTQVFNGYTTRRGVKGKEFRPKGRTYVTPYAIRIAVFTGEGLKKPRSFMVGSKKCFNFVGYCPPRKPQPKPEPKKVCATLKICKKVKDDQGSPANIKYTIRRQTAPGSNSWEDITTLTTNENGRTSTELRKDGTYEAIEEVPANYRVLTPANGIFRFTVTTETDTVLAEFVNEYCPPKPKDVCVTLKICKEVEGDRASPAGFLFSLEYETPDGWKSIMTKDADGKSIPLVLKTNESGRASTELRRAGRYRLTEQAKQYFENETPKDGIYVIDVTADDEVITRKYVNRYCPPQRPKINSTVVDQPIVRIQERPQYPILPQERVQPGESVRQERIATLGVGGSSGGSSSRRTRCNKCGSATSCPHRNVPGGNIPPGGQPPRDPTSGKPPTGGRPPGH